MFDAFLSCRCFGLVGKRPDEVALAIAQRWSGRPELQPNAMGQIAWTDLTTLKVPGYAWISAPPAANISVQNGLVRLGQHDGAAYYAFASPLPGIATGFTLHIPSFLGRHSPATQAVRQPGVRLHAVVEGLRAVRDTHFAPRLRACEGSTEDGLFVSIRQPHEMDALPALAQVQAIEIEQEGRITRIDNELNMRVADVASEFDIVAESLQKTFSLLAPHLVTSDLPMAAAIS